MNFYHNIIFIRTKLVNNPSISPYLYKAPVISLLWTKKGEVTTTTCNITTIWNGQNLPWDYFKQGKYSKILDICTASLLVM